MQLGVGYGSAQISVMDNWLWRCILQRYYRYEVCPISRGRHYITPEWPLPWHIHHQSSSFFYPHYSSDLITLHVFRFLFCPAFWLWTHTCIIIIHTNIIISASILITIIAYSFVWTLKRLLHYLSPAWRTCRGSSLVCHSVTYLA